MKDEIIKEEPCRSITPSLNMCDIDERDWTSLESSSESIVECSGDEETMVSLKTTKTTLQRTNPGTKILMEGEVSQAELLSLLSSQAVFCFPISLLLEGCNFQDKLLSVN